MSGLPILSLVTFLPLIGALAILLLRPNAKIVALATTLATFVLSLGLWTNFDPTNAGFQFVEQTAWIPGISSTYHLGIDGISLFFVLLTTLLMPLCILASWTSITEKVREYMVAFLLLETLVIGVFVSLDFLLFYFFFEGSLIPMFFIIGIWGGENRVYAAFKFFLYTLAGSVLMLIAMLYIYFQVGTFDVPTLMNEVPKLPAITQYWLWLAFFASFAVKVPMWPFHTWLPDAHVQAPTAGSVILAGVLLKLGAYGFIRFSMPMLPDATVFFQDMMFGLSMVAVVYTSLVALMQTDMKKLIAYSSVAHMGIVTLGLFAMNQQGIEGALFQMLSHGLVSAALFLCVGVLYDRMHTKEIAKYGGLVNRMPNFAFLFLFFTLGGIGLPSTSGFVGEFLSLTGTYMANTWAAFVGATGVILGAAYMLWLYKRVVFGEITNKALKNIEDVNRRECLIFLPLVLLVLWMGIFSNHILSVFHAPVEKLIQQIEGR